MVKNLPTVERSTRIRFGKNCRQEQADNTIVFNASDEFLEANTSNAIYMTPMRLREDVSDRNITVLTFNQITKEITDSGAVAEDIFDFSLQNATLNGNVTANTVSFNNPETSVTTLSNVGVANGSPVHTLDVGSNLYVDDVGSNVLVVSGNTHITQDLVVDGNVLVEGVVTSFHSENFKVRDGIIELGKDNTLFDTTLDLGLVLTRPESNVTIGFVESTDEIILAYTQSSANGKTLTPLTSEDVNVHVYGRLYTEANVGIVNTSPIHTLDVGSNLFVDDVGSNILVVTGNVEATAYYGDGTTLTGVALLSNFDSNVSRIQVLETDLASNASRVGTLEVDLTSNASRVGVLETDLASNAARVGTLEVDLTSNASRVGVLEVDLTSNAARVGTLETIKAPKDGPIFTGTVGIANAASTYDLSVGSNLFVDIDGSNVLIVNGNVSATSYYGDGSKLTGLVTALQDVSDNGNTTTNTIEFNNTATGLVTVSNIVAGGNVTATTFLGDGSQLTGLVTALQDVSDNGNTTTNTIEFNNTATGLVTVSNIVAGGNVTATTFLGDGSQLTGIVTTLQGVSDNGNTTSNTLQFTNAHTAFTTDLTSNVEVKVDQLYDVNLNAPVVDQLLVYDGTDWVNEYPIHTYIKIRNDLSGVNIGAGDTVYVRGTHNSNIINVGLAQSNSPATMPCIGISNQLLTPGQTGTAVAYGKALSVATNTFLAGETVYVSNTVPGGLSNVKPYNNDLIQNVGIVSKIHAHNGGVFVTGIGRANDIPNAPIVLDESDINYVYVNDQNNDLKKIEPANLLTQLQTLQQVTDTGNTTSNTIQFTNATTGLVTTANLEVGSNISVAGLTQNKFPIVGTGNFLEDSLISKTGGAIVISSDLEVLGNVLVTGNSYTVESNSLVINDRVLGIANNNTSHDLDIGIIMQHPGKNVALIHHGESVGSGDPHDHTFTIGYTQNTVTDNHIFDDSNLITVEILGNLQVQNSLTVSTGSYYGDGTTLTGLALLSDFTSNVSRIGVLETDLASNAARVGVLETDLTSNAARVGVLVTDLASNAARVGVLETDLTSNATRVGVLETDLTSNATRVGVLETDLASNAARVGVLETDLTSNAARVGVLETDVSSLETDLTSNAARVGVIETDLTSNAARVGVLETDLTSNAARVGTLETDKAGLLDPTFTSNITVSNVVYVTSGLVTNTGEVTKKTYSYSGSISSGDKPYINVNYTSNVFYSKISAQLVEGDEEVSTLVLEVGGGHKTGTTPSTNIAIGTKNIFGGTSTNPWNPTIITTGNRVSMRPLTILDGQGDYHIFIEYTSPKTDGGVTTIDEDSVTVATFTY